MEKDIKRVKRNDLTSIAESGENHSEGFAPNKSEIDYNRRRAAYIANMRTEQYGGKQ
jgi:hypothetical protein